MYVVCICVCLCCVCARTRVNEVPPALPDILVLSAPGRECQPEPRSHQTGHGRGRGRGRPLRSRGQRRAAKRLPASAGPAGRGPCPVSGRTPASCPSVHAPLIPLPQGRPRGARRRQPVADGSVFQDRPFRGGGKNWLPEMSWSGLDSPVFLLRGTGGLPASGRAAPLHLRPGAFVKDGLGEGRDPRVRVPRPFRGVLAVVASMFITLTVSLAPSRTGTRLSASWARFRPRSPGLTRKDRLRHGLPGGSAVRG